MFVIPGDGKKPSPVLIAHSHGGMARLSGLDKYWDCRPVKGPVLSGAQRSCNFGDVTNAVTATPNQPRSE